MIIRKNPDFSEIFQHGKHISNRYFSIAFLDGPTVQIGFTCRRCKNAYQRNRLKRLGRELARTSVLFRSLSVKMILVMKETADTIPYQLLKNSFEELISKIAQKSQSWKLPLCTSSAFSKWRLFPLSASTRSFCPRGYLRPADIIPPARIMPFNPSKNTASWRAATNQPYAFLNVIRYFLADMTLFNYKDRRTSWISTKKPYLPFY